MGISAFLLARNEADRIGPCLASLEWADEIVVVVDTSTTDNTAEICRQYGARVVEQTWLGYAQQQQIGLNTLTQEWVFLTAADERVTPKLRDEILALLRTSPLYDAYEVPSCNLFMGKRLRAWYPDHHKRLFRRNKGCFPEKPVHESWEPFDPALPTGRLRHDILHDSYRSVAHCVQKWMRYAELAAPALATRRTHISVADPFLHAFVDFFKYQLLKRGFLDGAPGLIYNLIHAFYVFSKYVQAMELTRKRAVEPVKLPQSSVSLRSEPHRHESTEM